MTEEFKRFATCECRTGWHERCERETETELAEAMERLEAKEEGFLYGPNGE